MIEDSGESSRTPPWGSHNVPPPSLAANPWANSPKGWHIQDNIMVIDKKNYRNINGGSNIWL